MSSDEQARDVMEMIYKNNLMVSLSINSNLFLKIAETNAMREFQKEERENRQFVSNLLIKGKGIKRKKKENGRWKENQTKTYKKQLCNNNKIKTKLIISCIYMQNGFFVEAGAADCELSSSLPLEHNFGWTGRFVS